MNEPSLPPEPAVPTPPAWVALFPLPDVVLLPTAVLPLHIFEQRYRKMTADALAGDHQIAMALLNPGWETQYQGVPAIEPVVCVGEITGATELPDGRYHILLKGLARARIVEEDLSRPYRRARLEPITEIGVLEIDLERERNQMRRLLEQTALARTELARQCRKLCETNLTTPALADVLAFNLIGDAAEKQRLLEEPDQRARVARVVKVLGEIYPQRLMPSIDRFPPSLN